MNGIELRSYIRYQLSQLGGQSGAHAFERLCFELARQRHVRNILPATGPVQAGGDQGRDFESYRTYLTDAGLGASAFVAAASAEMIVGACPLERRDTASKIRSDLVTIFATGERPDRVIYFCEPNLPVAHRHRLQAHCRETYGAALDLHDGEAIADQLADPDTFWIASEFLAIPADFYPAEDVDEDYTRRKTRWIVEQATAENYADFVDIKTGLRTATYEDGGEGCRVLLSPARLS